MTAQWSLVGLAHPRAAWPAELARLATSGAAPIEHLTVLGADELRAVIGAGRPVSAVLLDAGANGVGPSLVAEARSAGCTVIGVESTRVEVDWEDWGADGTLRAGFTPAELIDALGRFAPRREERAEHPHVLLQAADADATGTLVAVMGPGGTGASVVAMALAQGLGRGTRAPRTAGSATPGTDRGTAEGDPPPRSAEVALLDGARRADLAMYHDVGDVLPGLPELVEAVGRRTTEPAEVRRMLFAQPARGYDLMLGLRRGRDWAGLRPGDQRRALEHLLRAYPTVVLDCDSDLDGATAASSGSAALAERHALALAATEMAAVVVVVGAHGAKGVHDLVRLVGELVEAGVPARRIVPVANGAGRSMLAGAVTVAFARLTSSLGGVPPRPLVGLPRLRRLDAVVRDASALPAAVVGPVTDAVTAALDDLESTRSAA